MAKSNNISGLSDAAKQKLDKYASLTDTSLTSIIALLIDEAETSKGEKALRALIVAKAPRKAARGRKAGTKNRRTIDTSEGAFVPFEKKSAKAALQSGVRDNKKIAQALQTLAECLLVG